LRDDQRVELEAAAAAWHQEGFVVLPRYLDAPDLDAARADLPKVFPSPSEFHSEPDGDRNSQYVTDEFGGIIEFPFPSVELCRLVVHPKLINLAEAIFRTDDIRVYASELWAKFTGAADYQQEHHRDYLNHTPLVPSANARYRGLEMFIWLNDVPEARGPTHIVPMTLTSNFPALPHGYLREQQPEMYERELSAAGSAGTVVAYSTDTFHRGTQMTEPGAARYSAHVSYRHADNQWTSRHAWGDRSFTTHWRPFVEHASPRQLRLFGFPAPGHPYWTQETLAGLRCRYPAMNMTSWEEAAS